MNGETTIKRINIKEFRENGYLQELNRRFLHPLGLALEILMDEDGKESLSGIWDYREDDEGIYYDIQNSDDKSKKEFKRKHTIIENEFLKRLPKRKKKLGFEIEPIK